MKSGRIKGMGKNILKPLHSSIMFLIFIVVIPLTGCYQIINLNKIPDNSDKLNQVTVQKPLPPVYLKSIQGELSGSGSNINAAFEQRFVGRLQETRLFEDVIGILGREKSQADLKYEMYLKIAETQELDRLGNGIKGFFVGLSLFILTPVLPMDYRYGVQLTLTVRKPNGVTKYYKAESEGTAYYTMTHQLTAIRKVTDDTVEKCIISIMNQLVADNDLRVYQ
jgi:hypothetical protein